MKDVRVLALVGPTAAGKTAVSLEVAERLGAEIVSVDSMQIYRALDIGTDKATPEMRARVPHHLLDLKEPQEPLTVSEFQDTARRTISDIATRGRVPLLVGGSGLYFRAVVDDLNFPPRSGEVRGELEETAERIGPEELHARLRALDPAAAERIEPRNVRRTIRALEVIELTGRPFSENDSWDRFESIYDLRVAGLTRRREGLYRRIDVRAEDMIARGLIDEVRRLRDRLGPTASQALGYKQVLENPDAAPADLAAEIARATRRFARRQLAWFKGDPRIVWFEADRPDLPGALASFYSSGAPPDAAGGGTVGA